MWFATTKARFPSAYMRSALDATNMLVVTTSEPGSQCTFAGYLGVPEACALVYGLKGIALHMCYVYGSVP